MRPVLPLAVLTLAAVGCGKSIEPAEGECPDLVKQAFRDASFETEEEEEALQGLLLGIHNNCFDTVDQDYKDRIIDPGKLTEEYLDGLPVPPDSSIEDQQPLALSYISRHDFATHVAGMQDTNQTCLGSDSTKYALKTWTGGEDCFFDGTCNYATSETRSYTKNLIAQVWIDSYADYYRTTIPFEGGEQEVIVSRGWIDQMFNSGFDGEGDQQWQQRYVLDIYYPNPDNPSETMRYYAFWSAAELAVSDKVYEGAVIDGLEENYVNVDLWFDGEVCETRDWDEDDLRDKWG